VLIAAEETSANDGVARSRSRFAPWDTPEGPGSSVEGQADHRLAPAPAATSRAASRVRPVRTDRAGAASLKTGTGPGDAPSCAVAVVTYVKPIQP
jgi:hypothetical protein